MKTDHPLTRLTTIDAGALKTQRIITLTKGTLGRKLFDSYSRRKGLTGEINIQMELATPKLVSHMARNTNGIGILSKRSITEYIHDPSLSVVEIDDDNSYQFINLVTAAPLKKYARKFHATCMQLRA